MVLYDTGAMLDFPRYGITIPALDSRKVNTVAALKKHPELGGRIGEWLIDGFDETTSLDDLSRVHELEYSRGFFDGRAEKQYIQAYELVNPDGSYNRWVPEKAVRPLSELTPSLMRLLAGTWKAAVIALDEGFCHYMGGGAHHGHYDFGHGFCPVNDVAVAVRRLQAGGRVKRVWIIDTDAHKGDGTAAIFSVDDSVKTLSIHMARGWPLDGSLPPDHPSWIPSDIDVPVESGEEDSYLERLDSAMGELRRNSAADLAVVLAGADPWEKDGLPSSRLLNLSLEQMIERDRMVYGFLEDAGLASVWVTAGGYGDQAWRIHAEFLSWALTRRLGGGSG
jgi:acetoin utilization deacetylase AcuC-like enzyme